MKKYLVFMFCLVLSVSFVSCSSRQPKEGKIKDNSSNALGQEQVGTENVGNITVFYEVEKFSHPFKEEDLFKCCKYTKISNDFYEFSFERYKKEKVIMKLRCTAKSDECSTNAKELGTLIDGNKIYDIYVLFWSYDNSFNDETQMTVDFFYGDDPSCTTKSTTDPGCMRSVTLKDFNSCDLFISKSKEMLDAFVLLTAVKI
jgi:hypothetical protein